MKLKILVPAFNAKQWITDCLLSIVNQKFKAYECLIIDDASTDGTFDVINNLKFLDERFLAMRNSVNVGPLANTYNGFERLGCRRDPEAILTIVDGDDRLAHNGALDVVKNAYDADPGLLMTYGNYSDDKSPDVGKCGAFPPDIIASRQFRTHPACVSCLRTFKAKLWNGLIKDDLIDPDTGKFFSCGGDVAYCLPLLEMAGSRFRFIQEIIYIYTTNNPLSDFRIRWQEQLRVDKLVRSYPRYPLLRL